MENISKNCEIGKGDGDTENADNLCTRKDTVTTTVSTTKTAASVSTKKAAATMAHTILPLVDSTVDNFMRDRQDLELIMLQQLYRQKLYEIHQLKTLMRENEVADVSKIAICELVESLNDDEEKAIMILSPKPNPSNNGGDHELEYFRLSDDANRNRSFAQDLADWTVNNEEQLRTLFIRMKTIQKASYRLSLGGFGGYLAAVIVKKYGKPFFYSVAGSYILLKIAHSKGYVNIDWVKLFGRLDEEDVDSEAEITVAANSILEATTEFEFDESSGNLVSVSSPAAGAANVSANRQGRGGRVDVSNRIVENDPKIVARGWMKKKLCKVGIWAQQNSAVAAGFAFAFVFKTFSK